MQDLNRDFVLSLAGGSLDAALRRVGVRYQEQPTAVFAEVRCLLTADAPFVVSF